MRVQVFILKWDLDFNFLCWHEAITWVALERCCSPLVAHSVKEFPGHIFSWDLPVAPRAFCTMATATPAFAPVDCLHMCWLKDSTICSRLDEGGRLVRSTDGTGFVEASEEHCVENRGLLEPYMVRQQSARSLDIPDLESLKSQLIALHMARVLQKSKGHKKQPKALLDATVELIQSNVHLDAKSLKRLFSYARHRFLKEQTPREPRLS